MPASAVAIAIERREIRGGVAFITVRFLISADGAQVLGRAMVILGFAGLPKAMPLN